MNDTRPEIAGSHRVFPVIEWLTVAAVALVLSFRNSQGGFVEQSVGLPELRYPLGAWGDYDHDGDLDLILNSSPSAANQLTLWRNDGGTFAQVAVGFPPTGYAMPTWGDFDQDGDLDLALTAYNPYTYESRTQIWRNDQGTFVHHYSASAGASPGRLEWADYDGDGDLDLFFNGSESSTSRLYVLRNDHGTFSQIICGPGTSGFLLADYDGDGDLDAIGSDYRGAHLLQNNQGQFSQVPGPLEKSGARATGFGFVDLDGDGDADILLTKTTDNPVESITQLFRNTSGAFSEDPSVLPKCQVSTGLTGDFDNDGDLDLIAIQWDASGPQQYVVLRNANGTFSDVAASFPPSFTALGRADYDNDGDLDFVGRIDLATGSPVRIWRNDETVQNTPPAPPKQLATEVSSAGVRFSWEAALDAQTPAPLLTYNLRVGTAPGTANIMSPQSDLSSGRRQIPEVGNVGARTATWLRLPVGTYYWSVQAVDTAYLGGPFALEGTFDVTSPEPGLHSLAVSETETAAATLNVEIDSRGLPTTVWFEWGSTTSYGQTTGVQSCSGSWSAVHHRLTGLVVGGVYHFRSVAHSDAGTVYGPDQVFTTHPFVLGAYLETGGEGNPWGDYDNDGDLDLALKSLWRNDAGVFTKVPTGLAPAGVCMDWGDFDADGDLDLTWNNTHTWPNVNKILRNQGGVFTDSGVVLPASDGWVTAWGDYDNDGDLDLVITGNGLENGTVQIWRNEAGVFTRLSVRVPALANPEALWGDYDGDGDLDLLLHGDAGGHPITRICRNDRGDFSLIDLGLPDTNQGLPAWGDYDNDGDLDIALKGFTGSGESSLIWRNDGGTFTPALPPSPDLQDTRLAWGDYDNDGDLDLALNGVGDIVTIYRNDGSSFTDIEAGLTGRGNVSWADYDNDGDLDLLIGGQLWRNEGTSHNTQPLPPTGLSAQESAGLIRLSWNPGSDAETPAAGLSYNLFVGRNPWTDNTLPAHADLNTGFRRIPIAGSHRGVCSAFIDSLNLPMGTYYWSVQTVDNSLAGSAFSPQGSFQIQSGPPLVQTLPAQPTSSSSAIFKGLLNGRGAFTQKWFDYGLTTGYGQTAQAAWGDSIPGTEFSVSVSGLQPGTVYHYRAVASSVWGTTTSPDRTFKTSLFTPVATPFPKLDSAASWGDFDGDNDLDLALAGRSPSNFYETKIFRNDAGVFTDILAPVTAISYGTLAWSDYDRDGDLDLLISGQPAQTTQIWRNDGGVFHEDDVGLPGTTFGQVSWGNFNNDGWPDILLVDYQPVTEPIQIWINREGRFERQDSHLPDCVPMSVTAADYDQDGDLDLLIAGDFFPGGRTIQLWNNHEGVFTRSNTDFPDFSFVDSIWGDADGDGDPDVLFAGYLLSRGEVAGVWRNDQTSFTEFSLPLPPQAGYGWVDFDADGDLDIFIGSASANIPGPHFWRNDGNFSFSEVDVGWTDYADLPLRKPFAWGDYDGDGDLDLVARGQLWRNDSPTHNTPPSAPAHLAANIVADRMELTWTAATDAQTPPSALKYRLRIGSAPGQSDVLHPQPLGPSDVQVLGSPSYTLVGTKATLALQGLPIGTYYWSVQAIDALNAGGAWAVEQTLTIADSDSDQLPDWWETAQGLSAHSAADAAEDSDGDGYSNAQEYAAGTLPLDPSSALRITDVEPTTQNLAITFQSASGKFYQLEQSSVSPVGPWTPVVQNISGTGGALTVSVPNVDGESKVFYQVILRP